MPENYLVSTQYVAKDQMAAFWAKQIRSADKFGDATTRNFNRASKSASKFDDVLKGIIGAQLVQKAFFHAREQVTSFITEAARVESAETSFKRLVGGMEAAKQTITELRVLGAETPFEFRDLADASTTLLGFEAATRQTLIPTLRMLGDMAGGSADKLGRIVLAFGQIEAGGKASMQDINQLVNAGIPILGEMARQWGVTVMQARKMVSQGKATSTEVRKAFRTMTSEGGKFFRGMADASQTFEGRMSTLRDEINMAKQTIGLQFLPILKDYITDSIDLAKTVGDWAEANQTLIKEEVNLWLSTTRDILKEVWPIAKTVLGIVSDMLPVIRAMAPILPVLAAGWAANKLVMTGIKALEFGKWLLVTTGIVKTATAAQWGWNVALSANPIGAIILGITGLVAGIVLVVKHWDFLEAKIISGTSAILTAFKEDFFETLRISTWVFRMIARGAFEFIRRMGEIMAPITGDNLVEREFGNLVNVMDDLDAKLKEASGVKPWWIERDSKQAMENLFKTQRLMVEPPSITIAPSKYVIDDLPEMTQALKLDVRRLNVENLFSQMREAAPPRFTGLVQPQVNIAPAAAPPAERGGFVAPDRVDRQVIEHRMTIDIPGAPEGTKITIGKSKATAPPVSVNLLGKAS
jgi:tape measure domain-containing protein